MYRLTEETYVNADSTKVVPKGSIESAYLLGMTGDEISDETAARLGLNAPEAPAGYADLSVKELSALVAEKGIELGSKPKKADLVAALDQADAEAAAAAEANENGSGNAAVESPKE